MGQKKYKYEAVCYSTGLNNTRRTLTRFNTNDINKIIDEINYIDTECDINYADIDTITIIFNQKK